MSAVKETDEINKLKSLNSFLIKELNQFKSENHKLKQENATLKIENEELKDKNKKLNSKHYITSIIKNKFDSPSTNERISKEENYNEINIKENKLSNKADMILKKMKERIKDNQTKDEPILTNKVYTSLQSLLLQKKTVNEQRKDNKCGFCGKIFPSSDILKSHILWVHGPRNLKCVSCDKSFSKSHDLKKHISTIHDGHKDYKCESCGKSFSQAHNKNHVKKIHKGQK